MPPSPNLPHDKEAKRRKRIGEQSRKRHRLDKLDIHIHEDSITEEVKERMIDYGYVNLCKAVVRHGLEHEGMDYLKGKDAQFWLSIVRKAIEGERE